MLGGRMTPSPHSRRPIDPAVDAALLAMCVFWAVNVVLLKILLKDVPPPALSAGRYVIVSALALLVAAARGGPWTIAARDLPRALASGLLGVALFQVLFMEGLQRTSAFASNLIQGTEPLFALLFLRVLARAQVSPRQWWGVLIALFGALVFFIEGSTGDAHLAFGLGELLNLSGAFAFALYGLVSGPLFARYPGHTVMAITMLAGTIPLVAWAWPGLHAVDWTGLRSAVWAGLVFSSVVPLYLGFWIWNWAVSKKGLDHASLYIFVDIVLSGCFAYAILGERFGPLRLVGALVIVTGVYLARSGEV
jgi:drug/metabolite transporter (DMT)-like permease